MAEGKDDAMTIGPFLGAVTVDAGGLDPAQLTVEWVDPDGTVFVTTPMALVLDQWSRAHRVRRQQLEGCVPRVVFEARMDDRQRVR